MYICLIGRKDENIFYLTTYSAHSIYGYGIGNGKVPFR